MTTATKAWPTPLEFARAGNSMGGRAHDQVEVLLARMSELMDLDVCPSIVEDAEPLTLETLGAFTACLAKLRLDLEYALAFIRTMELMRDAMATEVEEVLRDG